MNHTDDVYFSVEKENRRLYESYEKLDMTPGEVYIYCTWSHYDTRENYDIRLLLNIILNNII